MTSFLVIFLEWTLRLILGQDLKRLIALLGTYVASGGALLASSAALLVTFGLLARHMGPEQFALNATLTALTNVAVQICGLGSQESLVRRVAQKPSIFPVMLGHVHVLNITSGLGLFLIGMIAIPLWLPISSDATINYGATALILITNIFLLKIIWLATNSYVAHSRFAVANTIEIIFAALRMGVALVSCLIFNVSTVAEWAIWNFAAYLVTAIISIVALQYLGKPKFGIVKDEVRIGILFASQFFFKAVRSNADILVLSAVASTEIIGSYSIARRLMEASYMSVEALNRIMYPGSAATALSGMENLFQRARRMLTVTTVIAAVAACFVWFISPWLPMLFGQEYVSLVWLNRAVCWIVIPMAVCATAFEAIGASGQQNIRARIANGASVAGAALVALAAWKVGIDGVVASFYLIEIMTAIMAWRALLGLRKRAEPNLIASPG